MTLPEPRDLPAGHHEARRTHLLREITLSPRARRTPRRLLTGAGVVLLAGTGVGAAGVFHGASAGSTTTVACFGRAAIDHSSMAVIHPQDTDPVRACQAMWHHRLVHGPPSSRTATVPPLVACRLAERPGRAVTVGVFPGPPSTCATLGLSAMTGGG
jgi:hypothetical protein